jgi:Zn-dependent M28 family amino/carboxypeptidase
VSITALASHLRLQFAAMLRRICVLLLISTATLAQVYVNELKRDAIESRLSHFAKKSAERQAILKEWFQKGGCPNLIEQPVKHTSVPNLVCILPGETERTIIVGAHFDCVDNGDGVADNWSGASLLPSLLETLNSRPRKHTYIFIAFTDEEEGMVGSEFYANHMTKEERQRTDAMVNMDTLGLSPTKIWLSHSDKNLVNLAATVANAMKLPIAAVNFEKVGATDSDSFLQKKMPTITIHSVTQQNHHILHSTDDNLKSINMDDYYATYRFTAVYLALLDTKLPLPR